MKFIKYKTSIKIILLFTIVFILTGCSHNIILMDPKGAISVEQKKLILIVLSLMLLIIIPVILMTIIFTIKYRANNKKVNYWPDWSKSNKIELVCWIIPIIIVFIIAIITWKTTHKLDPYKIFKSNKNPITIQVIATNWKWFFIYPEKKIATINEIAIPINVPIIFKITSESVMNSFFIPSLGSQIYAMAGMQTQLNLIANISGIYKGFSSSYSGCGFFGMKFNVIVTPNILSFNKWIQKVKLSTNSLDSMNKFYQLAKPSINVPITYFSSIVPNIYEELIFKINHINNCKYIKK